MLGTGASNTATGSISANTDSALTLARASDCVLISNNSAVDAYIRLNGAVSPTVYDIILAPDERAWITNIVITTVHVYANTTSGIKAVYW